MFSEFLQYKPIKFTVRLYQKAFHDDIFSRAAQVGFYFSFAIFPLLFFLLSLIGIILGNSNDYRAELLDYLRRIMPIPAFNLVETTISEVVQNTSTGKLTFGFLVAIWSASAGIDSLRIALNHVYSVKETRGFWITKPLSLFLTFGIGLLFFAALGIIFYGSHLISFSFSYLAIPIPSDYFADLLKLVTAFVVVALTFAIIYNLCPNHGKHRWQWISSGSIVAIVLWLLLSYSFRLYLQYFDTYARTYGSLGAVIVLMLWLYLTALVILIGGAINAILKEIMSERDQPDTQ